MRFAHIADLSQTFQAIGHSQKISVLLFLDSCNIIGKFFLRQHNWQIKKYEFGQPCAHVVVAEQ
jgi:hypothetical protein